MAPRRRQAERKQKRPIGYRGGDDRWAACDLRLLARIMHKGRIKVASGGV